MPQQRGELPDRPRLLQPRSRAEQLLTERAEQGTVLLAKARGIGTADEYQDWARDVRRWREVTCNALKSLYSTDGPADEFVRVASPPTVLGDTSPAEEFDWDKDALEEGLNKLAALKEGLEYVTLSDEAAAAGSGGGTLTNVPTSEAKVFVVHGHNEQIKSEVARLLEKAGPHEVLILHEQPNQGRTIIEKFEDYATTADHAVVLLTGDDVGRVKSASPESLQLRARQNVVLELGFFAGHLGRSRVTVLYEDGVEVPSDYLGVGHVKLDPAGAWKFELLKELRAAKLDYDLNALA